MAVLKIAARWGACGLLLLSACDTAGLAHNGPGRLAGPASTVGAADNWTAHGAAADESDYSRLDQINASNVGQLGLAWAMELPGEASLEATPLAVDGVLYFTGTYGAVYAVDAASGKLLWKFDPEIWNHNPLKMLFSFAVNRGVAYDNGKIFSAALDSRLFALDAKTGKLLWSVETTPPSAPHTVTGAPRTFNGKVIIGNGGADFGARGFVTAYDQATGAQLWRFYLTPGSPEENKGDAAMEKAAATWNGQYWKTGTGGGPWDSLTFDPEFNRVYVASGNAGPYDPDKRSPGGGDNLYTASIVALDADTGKYVWHYQVNPRDSWDYDSTQQMTLADLVIDGKKRKVLMQAPKNGFFYVLDRTTGKVISAEKLGKATWADHIDLATGRPVEAKNIRYETGAVTIWPGPMGAHSWMSQAYSPKTGLVYVPYMQSGIDFVRGGEEIPGGVDVGGLSLKEHKPVDPEDAKGALIAWDPVRQKAVWRVQHDYIWNGGVLATAGNLVFQGAADGYFSAYDATTGQRVWRFPAGMGIIAAPMSYVANGKQYVSVLAGYGGSAAIWGDLMKVGWSFNGPRRLLTFAIGGNATLPPSPPRDMSVQPLDDPSLKLDPKEVAAGHTLYMYCAACHGRNLVATGGPAPDLRASPIALDPESLWTVLHEGPLASKGMPQFPMLTRGQANQIFAYIRAGARDKIAANQAQGKAAP
jgi:quinohemoprotein ethanol dehydrogenase